ncbi:hypothetical protein RRG08_007644 [Elysia crispata]|uniref:Uncharacterized protein n=1 Tax=Elysia crispata TaxID=231223 RepID=A0AAE0Y493_9GAST|nr:hypothetical protein RRG08_007644 [Elysia crispata]
MGDLGGGACVVSASKDLVEPFDLDPSLETSESRGSVIIILERSPRPSFIYRTLSSGEHKRKTFIERQTKAVKEKKTRHKETHCHLVAFAIVRPPARGRSMIVSSEGKFPGFPSSDNVHSHILERTPSLEAQTGLMLTFTVRFKRCSSTIGERSRAEQVRRDALPANQAAPVTYSLTHPPTHTDREPQGPRVRLEPDGDKQKLPLDETVRHKASMYLTSSRCLFRHEVEDGAMLTRSDVSNLT